MTPETGLIIYGAVAVGSYSACLVYLSVCIHRGELKLDTPPTESNMNACVKGGAVASLLWPLTLVVLSVVGVVKGMHKLIGMGVRRMTRGARAAETLRKASKGGH